MTAAALELAYRHQDSFNAAAFWQAPEHDDEFGGALASLAAALEVQLRDHQFAMADKITTVGSLEAFLPRLRALLEASGILLVLDNLETLLTPDGAWRDPRWQPLIAASCSHRGESRVILTSRIPPARLAGPVLALAVHALSLDESAALARELPGLRGLLHADASPLRDLDETAVARDRDLVRRVLHVVQGHPKLMELADAASTEPGRLEAQLTAAEAAAQRTPDGRVLDSFFRDGATSLDAARFLDTLAAWTTTALAALPEPARLMAQFLAFAEDSDRVSFIIEANWADVWRRLARPGDPPAPDPLLDVLAGAALIQAEPSAQPGHGGQPVVVYRMHPGVSQAIRGAAGPGIRDATDAELAAFWTTVAEQATGPDGGEAGQVIVRAGLAAAPYLTRLQDWDAALYLLQEALNREDSPATVQAIASFLRAIAETTQDPRAFSLLARALQQADPAQAEQLMRASLAQATSGADWRRASTIAGNLVNMLRDTGRLRGALHLTADKAEYTRRAGPAAANAAAARARRKPDTVPSWR